MKNSLAFGLRSSNSESPIRRLDAAEVLSRSRVGGSVEERSTSRTSVAAPTHVLADGNALSLLGHPGFWQPQNDGAPFTANVELWQHGPRQRERALADLDNEENGETFSDRLKRYADRPVIDTLGWMTMYLQNQPAVELRRAREAKLYFCVYLLAHSIIQTVSELMFALTGLDGTHYFLEQFADGAKPDRKFSLISADIHEIRNLIAHRAYSKRQHQTQYFIDDIPEGWRREPGGTLTINPAIYSVQIENVFRSAKLYQSFRSQPDLQLLKLKYRFIRQWLELDKTDPIAQLIRVLDKLSPAADLEAEDAKIRSAIYSRYNL